MKGVIGARNRDDGTVGYSTGSDRMIAGTLGVTTVSGLAAGLSAWVATPRQLRLLSYGLFGGASIVFITTLILVAVAVTQLGLGASDGVSQAAARPSCVVPGGWSGRSVGRR
jgi:hypothetical protein